VEIEFEEELANDVHELPLTFQDIVKATNADPGEDYEILSQQLVLYGR